jgi:hypothetical protein
VPTRIARADSRVDAGHEQPTNRQNEDWNRTDSLSGRSKTKSRMSRGQSVLYTLSKRWWSVLRATRCQRLPMHDCQPQGGHGTLVETCGARALICERDQRLLNDYNVIEATVTMLLNLVSRHFSTLRARGALTHACARERACLRRQPVGE